MLTQLPHFHRTICLPSGVISYGIPSKVNVDVKLVETIEELSPLNKDCPPVSAALVLMGVWGIVIVVSKYMDGSKTSFWKYIFSIPMNPNSPVDFVPHFPTCRLDYRLSRNLLYPTGARSSLPCSVL